MKKIVITGGGTGGHVIPCLAVAETLKNDFEIHYIGSKDGIENTLIKNFPYIIFHPITTCKLVRSLTPKNLTIPFKLFKGYNESKKLMKDISPVAVFSKGGYVSVPVVYSSYKLKIPVISHESDLSMGLANKINLKKSKYMCCSFKDTSLKLKNKGIYTGSPIRSQIYKGSKENILKTYKIKNNKPSVLILGGSLGSKNLNAIVRNNLDYLTSNYNVFHICGKNNIIECNEYKDYYQMEFVNNIQDYYSVADVVISRAGSNVIFELLALKKPMILVPLEKNSRGDQIENALYFEKKGFAKMVRENDLDSMINESIKQVLNKKSEYTINIENENLDAVQKIASLIKNECN